jgi:microcystin-dependent protein
VPSRIARPGLAGTLVLIAMLVALSVPPAQAGWTARSSAVQAPPSRALFVLDARSGSLAKRPGKGRYLLTLRGVPATAVWFTDRPQRESGRMRLPALVKSWAGFGFLADLPNAVLSLTTAPASRDAKAFELGRPHYYPKKRLLRFRVIALPSTVKKIPAVRANLDRRFPRRFKAASLFIDDTATADGRNTDGSCTIGDTVLRPTLNGDAQVGYVPAEGQFLSIQAITEVYAVVGTTYGGDGVRSFAMPAIPQPPGIPNGSGLGLQWQICYQGQYPSNGLPSDGGNCTMGDLRPSAGAGAAAQRHAFGVADGDSFDSAQYPAAARLFSAGTGATTAPTFSLPDVAPLVEGMNSVVCLNGYGTASADGPQYRALGEVVLSAYRQETVFGPNIALIPANGQKLSPKRYPDLFALYGTTFGGDGKLTFGIPRLQPPAGTYAYVVPRGIYPAFSSSAG